MKLAFCISALQGSAPLGPILVSMRKWYKVELLTVISNCARNSDCSSPNENSVAPQPIHRQLMMFKKSAVFKFTQGSDPLALFGVKRRIWKPHRSHRPAQALCSLFLSASVCTLCKLNQSKVNSLASCFVGLPTVFR